MATYITIDGGTTNTRISLVKDRTMLDTVKCNVGARAGMEDANLLKTTVRSAIEQLLFKHSLTENDITRILASGMITSEFGLHQMPHMTVPAGIGEMHGAMEEVVLSEISAIPFVFMRGVKTLCDSLENADMMRGEETELMGILQEGACVYVLPGSHSKIIRADEEGRICEFFTMLTGEMAASLSQYTILKDAVSFAVDGMDEESLLKGYDYCNQKGINEALFKSRVMKNIMGCDERQIYSFFMGVILCGEINRVLNLNPEKIVIGGKRQFREAMTTILQKVSSITVICLTEEDVEHSSAIGMINIYEY